MERNTNTIKVGNLTLGGNNRVYLQSMTNTKTKDIDATVKQINELAKAGCDIIRVAVLDEQDAKSISSIKKQINIPLVCDIHFDYKLALICIEQGCDKVRINPGNIGSHENVEKVVQACKEKNIPIRIGINSGSIDKKILAKYGHNCPLAMIESAQEHIDILESLDFHDICLSFKSSDVKTTIEAYRLAYKRWKYPLHLGLTEAGTKDYSLIKSSAAIGALLNDNIGDTIRISISSDPIEEIYAGKKLLKAFGLINNVPDLVSCPTCGRTQWDIFTTVNKIEKYLQTIHSDIKVAIMGCAVNGPGEARDADIGVAGGINEALIFSHGEIIKKVKQEDVYQELINEINKLIKK